MEEVGAVEGGGGWGVQGKEGKRWGVEELWWWRRGGAARVWGRGEGGGGGGSGDGRRSEGEVQAVPS